MEIRLDTQPPHVVFLEPIPRSVVSATVNLLHVRFEDEGTIDTESVFVTLDDRPLSVEATSGGFLYRASEFFSASTSDLPRRHVVGVRVSDEVGNHRTAQMVFFSDGMSPASKDLFLSRGRRSRVRKDLFS